MVLADKLPSLSITSKKEVLEKANLGVPAGSISIIIWLFPSLILSPLVKDICSFSPVL